MTEKSIIIADDHPTIHKGLKILLQEHHPGAKFQHCYTFKDLLLKLRNGIPDLLILDLNLPENYGFSTFQKLISTHPELRVLIFSQNSEDKYAATYLQLGAYGYLEKVVDDTLIIKAVNRIMSGGKYLSYEMTEKAIHGSLKSEKNSFDTLSKREKDVCSLLIRGFSLTHIADHMDLNLSTVSTYKTRIFEKLSIGSYADFYKFFNTEI